MKRLTIGRNTTCDIVLDNKMVSRNHALLNIYPSGKLEIVSMGTNGTKVKGNLISNGQRYPLKRGDDVTFAGTAYLDWELVPDPMKKWRITGYILGGAALLALAVWGILMLKSSNLSFGGGSKDDFGSENVENPIPGGANPSATPTDSTKTSTPNDSTSTEKKGPSEEEIRKAFAKPPVTTPKPPKETKEPEKPADNGEDEEWGFR